MDYYTRRQRASMKLDNLVKNAKSKLSLVQLGLTIESEFGLGEKFVKQRLEKMEKAGYITILNDEIERC